MFEVLFATRTEGAPTMPWAPKEGDGFECSKREAKRRADHLLEAGRKGEPVEGLVPYSVEVRDAATGKVCYAASTDPDDEPVGEWVKAPN